MKKLFLLSLLSLLLMLVLLVPAFAAEGASAPAGESAAEPSAPLTALVADFFTENADTILGALTLLGSLLVAFLYKKGLLPLVRSGLSALASLLGKTGEITEKFTSEASTVLTDIKEQTAPVLAAVSESRDALLALGERMAALEDALAKSEADRKSTAAVLATETELFYELLSSVNLPQAQKDSMTESYYRLKQSLESRP